MKAYECDGCGQLFRVADAEVTFVLPEDDVFLKGEIKFVSENAIDDFCPTCLQKFLSNKIVTAKTLESEEDVATHKGSPRTYSISDPTIIREEPDE